MDSLSLFLHKNPTRALCMRIATRKKRVDRDKNQYQKVGEVEASECEHRILQDLRIIIKSLNGPILWRYKKDI